MRATVLAVGSELLAGDRTETNSLLLARVLAAHGVGLAVKTVVGDESAAIARALRELAATSDLVLVSGGLGPTADDLTREGVAEAFGLALERRAELVEELRRRFASFGYRMPAVNEKQADVPAGAAVLANPLGSAPGLRLEAGGATLFLLPGVPRELAAMIEREVAPWLAKRRPGAVLETRFLKVAGVPESTLEERLAPFYAEFGSAGLTILSRPGIITLRLTAGGAAAERRAWLAGRGAALERLLGDDVFSHEAEGTLESEVGRLLAARGETVATAESCTGGLIAEHLTRVAGASAYFLGALVTYSNAAKRDLLGVPAEMLERHGAVSEEAARAMASGLRRALGPDHAIAVTGIAGPAGGSRDKPVGTVHVVVSSAGGEAVRHRRFVFPGGRARVRALTAHAALDLLRRRLAATGVAAHGGA